MRNYARQPFSFCLACHLISRRFREEWLAAATGDLQKGERKNSISPDWQAPKASVNTTWDRRRLKSQM